MTEAPVEQRRLTNAEDLLLALRDPDLQETWANSFYGTVDSSGEVWGVVFQIKNFRGPGTYQGTSITIIDKLRSFTEAPSL